MILLAMDTSTSAITVAVRRTGAPLVTRAVVDLRGHTEHLAPLLEQVMRQAGVSPSELTGIAVGTGPGPFTGLRVGIVTARTMGFALGVPVHGVCSLDALAWEAARSVEGELAVATDARRKEVYWARYLTARGAVSRLSEPAVDRPAEVPAEVRSLPTAGRGPLLFPELFAEPIAGVLDVDAGAVAHLAAEGLAAGTPMPVDARYLRRPDAHPVGAPKSTVALPPGRSEALSAAPSGPRPGPRAAE